MWPDEIEVLALTDVKYLALLFILCLQVLIKSLQVPIRYVYFNLPQIKETSLSIDGKRHSASVAPPLYLSIPPTPAAVSSALWAWKSTAAQILLLI